VLGRPERQKPRDANHDEWYGWDDVGHGSLVVTDLADGVHAVTTSADPETAALIQAQVTEMYARLGSGNAFPYPMSPSVPVMFENSTLYQRNLTALPDGIDVTKTSTDPAMIKIIQSHAREITGFVREGVPAMMRGMMR
jgi:hypothetical protein